MKHAPDFETLAHDPDDPNPWLALYLDRSTPLGAHVKRAWLADSSSPSRQYLLPIVRPLARLTIILFQLLKIVMPRNLRAGFRLVLHALASETLHALLQGYAQRQQAASAAAG